MTWKNLHFRPPIMKDTVVNGVSSELLLIRLEKEPFTTFAGYIQIRKTSPAEYHVCGRGIKEHVVIPSRIEWMEVPT